MQSLLFLVLPTLYAALPALLLLLVKIADTVLVSAGIMKNPYLRGSIQTRVSSQLPDSNGEIKAPGQEKIAVLLLGNKTNHPLGIFAPGVRDLGDHFMGMMKELYGDQESTGFLGASQWEHTDDNGIAEGVNISYWRSIEDVHRFAHGPVHRRAWNWWDKNAKDFAHIGLMHEVFEAPAGMWEGVYLNFQPTLIGSTTVLKKGDKLEGGQVSDEWIRPLVDASRGPMRQSKGRRGQLVKVEEHSDAYSS